MAGVKFRLTVPVVELDWWKKSRKELTEIVIDQHKEAWSRQVDPVTLKPWKPRKPPTGTWPILRKTGLMQDSANFRNSAADPMIWKVRTTDYGPFHQYGTSRMPMRRWLGINGRMTSEMEKVIAKHIFKRGKKTYRIP